MDLVPPHLTQERWHLACSWVQNPAPCQGLAISELLLGSSCLCPQLHIILVRQGWRINDGAAKSFPEVKAKKQQCRHPSGAWGTSRGQQLTGDYTVCGVQLGTGCLQSPRPLPGPLQCQHTKDRLFPASHGDVKAQPLLKASSPL